MDYDRHQHGGHEGSNRGRQELHHAGRTPAAERRAAVPARQRTASGDARWWPGRRATVIAVRTPTTSTTNGGCVRSIDAFAFSRNASTRRKWWIQKPREMGAPRAHVFFGATVRYANAAGTERMVRIVGVDEIDLNRNHISWKSPLARALMKSGPGDCVVLHAPGGTEQLRSSTCVTSASLWSRSAHHPAQSRAQATSSYGTRPAADR